MRRKTKPVTVALATDLGRPLTQIDQHRINTALPKPPKTTAIGLDATTPCYACGGPCEVDGTDWATYGPWRRHGACRHASVSPTTRVRAACEAHGLPVSREQATFMEVSVPTFVTVHPEPTWGTERPSTPWGHVQRNILRTALTQASARIVEMTEPGPCTDGPCAWCGTVVALTWIAQGHRRDDGTPAPMCGGCSVVYERRSSPSATFYDDQRPAIGEAITGVPTMLGEVGVPGLLAHAEAGGGDGTPWSHLPPEALDSYRWSRWARFPRHAPPEHREEIAQRRHADREEREARQREQAEADVKAADVYGFGAMS